MSSIERQHQRGWIWASPASRRTVGLTENTGRKTGRLPPVIWLLLQAGERPKEKSLGRGRTGDNAAAIFVLTAVVHTAGTTRFA